MTLQDKQFIFSLAKESYINVHQDESSMKQRILPFK